VSGCCRRGALAPTRRRLSALVTKPASSRTGSSAPLDRRHQNASLISRQPAPQNRLSRLREFLEEDWSRALSEFSFRDNLSGLQRKNCPLVERDQRHSGFFRPAPLAHSGRTSYPPAPIRRLLLALARCRRRLTESSTSTWSSLLAAADGPAPPNVRSSHMRYFDRAPRTPSSA